MRICFVAPANNYHTKKWVNWFIGRGHEIHVVSFIKEKIPGASIHFIDTGANPESGDVSKIKYLFHAKELKRIVDNIKPDVINVHYATSYGTVAALSGIKPYVLSVWGSDIYDFPKKSMLHKAMLQYSLRRATWLFSTSKAMAKEGSKYTKKKFEITPFGVDMDLFNPGKRTRPKNIPSFKIGIVLSMADLDWIDCILNAVAIIHQENNNVEICARIFGGRSELAKYNKITDERCVPDGVFSFLGKTQEEIEKEKTDIDMVVIPSLSFESKSVLTDESRVSGIPGYFHEGEGLDKTILPSKAVFEVDNCNEREFAEIILKIFRDSKKHYELSENNNNYLYRNHETVRHFYCSEKRCKEDEGEVLISIEISQKQDFIVGTVKGLSDKYGIRYLLEATAIVRNSSKIPICLRIAGKGPQESEYRKLAKELGIDDITTWLGFISQEEAAKEWANMDVAVIPSSLESESFGVSAVEAQACGTPVIITNIPGLMEATTPEKSSKVIHRNNPKELADTIILMAKDMDIRYSYGKNGREFVSQNYEINKCFKHIERLLSRTVLG